MTSAVDSSILFDVLTDDVRWGAAARRALDLAVQEGPLVACAVVYAEIAAYFSNAADVDRFFLDLEIRLDPFGASALTLAASAWRAYTRARGHDVDCPGCGRRSTVLCPACQAAIRWRQHVIADFLIGGHAAAQADQLLTRDVGHYRRYFPLLRLGPAARA